MHVETILFHKRRENADRGAGFEPEMTQEAAMRLPLAVVENSWENVSMPAIAP